METKDLIAGLMILGAAGGSFTEPGQVIIQKMKNDRQGAVIEQPKVSKTAPVQHVSTAGVIWSDQPESEYYKEYCKKRH